MPRNRQLNENRVSHEGLAQPTPTFDLRAPRERSRSYADGDSGVGSGPRRGNAAGRPRRGPAIGALGADREGLPIFFVQDNGLGIDPSYHERVFGLFNKLDNQSEGTGIGLSLVKRIIEVHNGRIWVESEKGKGATFYFTLPAPPAKE